MLLLIVATGLFNPAATRAQSSVVATSEHRSATQPAFRAVVPNTVTQAQFATEAFLSQPVSAIGIRNDVELAAAEAFSLLGVPVFLDQNLEGVMDGESMMTMGAGVSIGEAMQRALTLNDAAMIVEPNGSIFVISIDDEWEPDYLRNITYDVTNISGSNAQAEKLGLVIFNTIASDSWEMNGGGNATLSIYERNGRILMTINQSYKIHLIIRRYFDDVLRLTGAVPRTLPAVQIPKATSVSAASSVVTVPIEQTTLHLRSRRGFARPRSGTAGGMGGGGIKGGGIF